MNGSNGNQIWILVVVVAVVLIGLWFLSEQNSRKRALPLEEYQHEDVDDQYHLLHNDDDNYQIVDNAFALGFGRGPGLYGSGRHTSELWGN